MGELIPENGARALNPMIERALVVLHPWLKPAQDRMRQRYPKWLLAVFFGLAALVGCARNPMVGSVSVPPIPAGEARLWVYRLYIPSETLNMTKVSMNGTYAGYAQLGGAFYRDVTPGVYQIEVESYGRDINQSADVALVAGQEAYVRVEPLRSWATGYGHRGMAGRDTFYARLILPKTARAEIMQSFFDGGS
jgi:hypothetical protein